MSVVLIATHDQLCAMFKSSYLFLFPWMEEIGSRVRESGASNESLPNTSSSNDTFEVDVNVDTSKKRKVMEPSVACWKHFDKFTD